MFPGFEGVKFRVGEVEVSTYDPWTVTANDQVLSGCREKVFRQLLRFGPGQTPAKAVAVQNLESNMAQVVNRGMNAP